MIHCFHWKTSYWKDNSTPQLYIFDTISFSSCFVEIDMPTLNFVWKPTGLRSKYYVKDKTKQSWMLHDVWFQSVQDAVETEWGTRIFTQTLPVWATRGELSELCIQPSGHCLHDPGPCQSEKKTQIAASELSLNSLSPRLSEWWLRGKNLLGFIRVGVEGKKEVSCLGLAMAESPVTTLGLSNLSPLSSTWKRA